MPLCRLALLLVILLYLTAGTVMAREQKYAIVLENGWWKAVDTRGVSIADSLANKRDDGSFLLNASSEGMFPVLRDGKQGYKNKQNQLVIPCIYSLARRRCWS
jgi:hypothetical protein